MTSVGQIPRIHPTSVYVLSRLSSTFKIVATPRESTAYVRNVKVFRRKLDVIRRKGPICNLKTYYDSDIVIRKWCQILVTEVVVLEYKHTAL